jgi:ABC transporter substrate-binding protein (ThiB subfamily)
MVVSKFIKWWIFTGVIGFAISLVGYIAFQNNSKSESEAISIDENSKNLVVVADSTFFAETGPGQIIADLFTKKTGVTVQYVPLGDSRITLRRLQADKNFKPDVILSLDGFILEEWAEHNLWELVGIDLQDVSSFFRTEALSWINDHAMPYDWAPLAFVQRFSGTETKTEEQQLKSWDELKRHKPKSVITPSPKTTITGMYLLWWLSESESTLKFEDLVKGIFKMQTPDWSSAFELYQKDVGELFFTYVTSIDYFLTFSKARYDLATLNTPLPVQFEYAVTPKVSLKKELSREFVYMLLEEEAQKALIEKNFMLGVTPSEEPEQQKKLAAMPTLSRGSFDRFNKDRKQWLSRFSEASAK